MREHEFFNLILESLNDYDYFANESPDKIIARRNGKTFTFSEHLSALVYTELSNQRPWKRIEENIDNINAIFHDFNPEYLKDTPGEHFESEIKKIKCGNRQIKRQMAGLKDNVETFEKIIEDYGSIDNFVTSDEPEKIAKILSKGKYKMKGLGFALALEYLKDVGIDTIKPDVHICRMLGRWGICENETATEKEAVEIIKNISKEFNMLNMEVDTILWQYCANDYLEICTSNPECEKCVLNGKCEYSL